VMRPQQNSTQAPSSTQTSGAFAPSLPTVDDSRDSNGNGSTGAAAGTNNANKYGLYGLLDVLRMSDANMNILALGSDLTSLGLNLNSSECLFSTFSSPWSNKPTTREPQYSLPNCYYKQSPPLKSSHLSKFQLGTLFYIFYAMPKDVLQAYAAQELYKREWRYHSELKLWIKRRNDAHPATTASDSAANQYIYFDINVWEPRLLSADIPLASLQAGLMGDDEVRMDLQAAQAVSVTSTSTSNTHNTTAGSTNSVNINVAPGTVGIGGHTTTNTNHSDSSSNNSSTMINSVSFHQHPSNKAW